MGSLKPKDLPQQGREPCSWSTIELHLLFKEDKIVYLLYGTFSSCNVSNNSNVKILCYQ
jgi:hypothetical protein